MKKTVLTVFKITLSLTIIAYIFRSQVNFNEFWQTITSADISLMILASLLFILTALLCMLRWQVLLKAHNIELPFLRVMRLFSIGMFFNTFMIGTTGGDLIKMFYISKQTNKGVEGSMSIFFDRFSGLYAIVLLAFIAVIIKFNDPHLSKLFRPVITFTAAMIGGTALFLWMNHHSKVSQKLSQLLARIKAEQLYQKIRTVILDFSKHPQAFLKALILSFTIHIIFTIINYWVGRALGITGVSLGTYCVLIPIIIFLSSIPISISGWGVGEALYIFLLAPYGVDAVTAVTLSITIKVYYYLVGFASVTAYIAPGLNTTWPQTTKESTT